HRSDRPDSRTGNAGAARIGNCRNMAAETVPSAVADGSVWILELQAKRAADGARIHGMSVVLVASSQQLKFKENSHVNQSATSPYFTRSPALRLGLRRRRDRTHQPGHGHGRRRLPLQDHAIGKL